MKYFTVTYISQKTLHPEGYKTFTEFVAAETKHAAKLKALDVLSEKDPDCCMMYKVPRLDEIMASAWCSGSCWKSRGRTSRPHLYHNRQ